MTTQTLPRLAKSELSTRAEESLRALIVAGDLKPGTRLIERDLADRLGISRTPLREALLRLQRDGLLADAEGRGVHVSRLSVSEITEIYEILGGLERAALRHSPAPTAEMITRLRRATAHRARAGRNIHNLIYADLEWHRALTAYSSNKAILHLLGPPRILAERYERAFFKAEINQDRSIAEHEQIQALVEAGDLHRAADLIEKHWLDNIQHMVAAVRQSDPEGKA